MSNLPKYGAEVFLKYLQNHFPYKSKYNYTNEERETVNNKYAKWNGITIALAFVFLFTLPFAYGWIFYKAYLFLYSNLIASPDIFFPTGILVFFLPGLLFTLCTIGFFIEWIQKLFLSEEYEVFEDYYNTKQKHDNHKATLWVAKFSIAPFALSLVLALTSYIIVSPDKFKVRKFYQLIPDKHFKNEVKTVSYYSHNKDRYGNKYYYPHYNIVLNSNEVISSEYYFNDNETTQRFIISLNIPIDSAGVDINY